MHRFRVRIGGREGSAYEDLVAQHIESLSHEERSAFWKDAAKVLYAIKMASQGNQGQGLPAGIPAAPQEKPPESLSHGSPQPSVTSDMFAGMGPADLL